MNRTTSSHLARSVIADHWTAAERARGRRAADAETHDHAGHLTALSAIASRLDRSLRVMSRRTAEHRALD